MRIRSYNIATGEVSTLTVEEAADLIARAYPSGSKAYVQLLKDGGQVQSENLILRENKPPKTPAPKPAPVSP